MFVTVVGFLLVLLTGGTHAFQLPKRVHARVIQPSFHRPSSLQMAAVKASSAVVVSPNVLNQFMAASVKNKVIVGAHAVAVVAILWLLKWILVAIQTTFFGKKEISKVAKGEKRFYGISRPLKSVPVQNPLSGRFTSTTPVSRYLSFDSPQFYSCFKSLSFLHHHHNPISRSQPISY